MSVICDIFDCDFVLTTRRNKHDRLIYRCKRCGKENIGGHFSRGVLRDE
jgi:hypothetical protein